MTDHRGPGQPRPNTDFITPQEQRDLDVFKLRFPADYPKMLQALANLAAFGMTNPVFVMGDIPGQAGDLYVVEGDLPNGERYKSQPHSHPMAALREAGTWLYQMIKQKRLPDPNKTPSASTVLGPDGRPLG